MHPAGAIDEDLNRAGVRADDELRANLDGKAKAQLRAEVEKDLTNHPVQKIAAALSDALADPAIRQMRGTAGRARLETHFTVDTMVERTIDVYNSLETHH